MARSGLAQYRNRPIYLSNDSFSGGRCSNGAALSSISVQWDIYDSAFTDALQGQRLKLGPPPCFRGGPATAKPASPRA